MKKLFSLVVTLALALSASAQNVSLAEVVKAAVAKNDTTTVAVFLNKRNTYELTEAIDLGQTKLILWGDAAKVLVSGEGQIATATYLTVRNVKFDCSAATKALIALNDTVTEPAAIFEGGQKVLVNDNKVSVEKCLIAGLKHALVSANKQPWALKWLTVYANVIQCEPQETDGKAVEPLINWYGGSTGAIQHLSVADNLIYYTHAVPNSWFVRFSNASNAQPQKVWGALATSDFNLFSNTICFPGKAFANNFPNKNNVSLNWKKNIFINTPYLQKTASSAKRSFSAEDNVLTGDTATYKPDATDLAKYGTFEILGITVPETTLDLDANNLVTAAAPFKAPIASIAGANEYGVPTVAIPFKNGITKAEGMAYEVVLSPDFLTDNTKDGKATFSVDQKAYPWLTYYNSTSLNDDGSCQVSTKNNMWASIDPATGDSIVMKVTGLNGRKDTPTLTEDVKNNWHKTLTFYVKGLTGFKAFVTGASKNGYGTLVLTADATDGTQLTAESDSIKAKGGVSSFATLALNPELGYQITAETRGVDLQFEGLQLYTDSIAFPVCYAPVDSLKQPGTCYEVVLGPDMLTTGLKAEAEKPCINSEAYPWIVYNNPTSKLDNGASEVQKSNRWTDLNPVTGEKGEFIQVTGKNGKVDAPVCAPAWNKDITFGFKQATKVVVYATGSASGSAADGNAIKATVTDNAGNTKVFTSTPGAIYGKGTASDKLEIALDADKLYSVTVAGLVKDIQILGLNIYGTDLTVAPAEDAPAIGGATAISGVSQDNAENAPMYNVAGQRVNGAARGLVIKNGKKYILR